MYLCLLVFFSFFLEATWIHRAPLTPGRTWCCVISESFTFLHPRVSAQPLCGFSLRGAWRLKGAIGSQWAWGTRPAYTPSLPLRTFYSYIIAIYHSFSLLYFIFVCVCSMPSACCLLPASLLFFNETTMCCNLRMRHWSATQLNYYGRNYLNQKSVFTLCWRRFDSFVVVAVF